MKFKLLSVIIAFVATTSALALDPNSTLAPLPQQVNTVRLAANILQRFPYRPIPFDAATSERIFSRYIKALDPEKLIFVQSDLDRFTDASRGLAAEVESGDLQLPFSVFSLFQQRVADRLGYARGLLKDGFDFGVQESFRYDRTGAQQPKDEEEVRGLWYKRVKNDWLQLKIAGKDDAAIRDTLDKRYAKLVGRIEKYKSNDVFQVFMEAVTNSVDPHTDYFGPAESANFDIAMKLSLVGIGAVLQDKDEYPTVRELVPGGPAALSGKLHVGDRIVSVGQGASGPMTDVVGMRLDEVVELVRGPKDTTVRLDILPADAGPDGKHTLVTLVRNKISLEQQAARKSIIEVGQGNAKRKVGVIVLPTFYQDFDARRKNEKDFRSASRDVKRLLLELKKEKVDAVLIDLRDNGGGSLDEAIALTGMFIGTGPVVQERNAQGQVRIDSSTAPQPVWEGPMGVLINRASASASEIFAAAIQDYGRGVIIGEPSFGKGTVQTIVNLDQIVQAEKPELGELKLTISQFFRINGGTTQLRGVTPDIGFPTISDLERFGESSYENALPWAQIRPASYSPAGGVAKLVPVLKRRHDARIAKDKDFQYLIEDLAELRERRNSAQVTLNEAERIKERDQREAKLKKRETLNAQAGSKTGPRKTEASMPTAGAQAPGAPSSDNPSGDEPLAGAKRKDGKDVWLAEAAHIMADEAELGGSLTRYAAGAGR